MPDEDPSPTPDAPAGDPAPSKPADPPAATADDKPLGEAGEKALEAMKARAREAEKAAKAASAELEKLRKSQMSDQEKAVAQARDEGRAEASSAAAQRLAGAEIKAALAGVVPPGELAGLVDDLNLSKYISEDGEPDADKIAALRARYAALTAGATPGTPPPPGVPKGARAGNGEVKQLDRNAMKTMSAAEIVAANRAGQFVDLMSPPSP